MRDLENILFGAILAAILITILLYLTCCASVPTVSPPAVPTTSTIVNTIQSTDWLMSILLMGCVAGLFAAFNGLKVGWAGVAACVGGIVLKAALSSTYVYWLCGFLFIGCVVAALASVLLKNTALREIIIGAQRVKAQVPDSNIILANEQSTTTQKLVQKVKGALKVKGVL